jgi:hypothetical protein
MKVTFNTCSGSIICHKGKCCYEDIFLNCNFELFGENCMEVITTGQIFSFRLQLIKVFEITRYICMNFFSWDVSSD